MSASPPLTTEHRLEASEAEALSDGSLLFVEDERGPLTNWWVFSRPLIYGSEGLTVFRLRGILPVLLSCEEFVVRAYRLLLGREADEVGRRSMGAELSSGRWTRARVLATLAPSLEAQSRRQQFVFLPQPSRWLASDTARENGEHVAVAWRPESPPSPVEASLQLYPGYDPADLALFEEFRDAAAQGESGFVVSFLGSRIRVSSLWQGARRLDGQVEPIPVPADHHAETIEWIGLLKAVKSADRCYVAMELGAGFGPWSVGGGTAARRRGIGDIRLYAVEADPLHFRLLQQNFSDNGFPPEQHTLIEAAVGEAAGVARWPTTADSREDWGTRPIEAGDPSDGPVCDYLGRAFAATTEIPVVAMVDLVCREPRWDLVHIDVQGGEFAIVRAALVELSARVHWLVIGTHSRKIEGELLALLAGADWRLEREKPCRFTFAPGAATLEAMTTLDGTQVWRNPHWRP